MSKIPAPLQDRAAPASAPVLDGAEAGVSHSVSGTTEQEPEKTTLKRVLWAFSPLALLGLLIALDVPLCPFRTLLGIPCPGCGLTRATEALMVGDLVGMLRFHPLAPLLTPVALFSVIRATAVSAGLIKSKAIDPLGRIPSWFWGLFGVALVGLWLSRAFGLFGGLPDPIDPANGLFGQGIGWLWGLLP